MNQTPYVFAKIVDVRDGTITERLTTLRTSSLDGSVRMLSWGKNDLRKDGQPDQRSHSYAVGITQHKGWNGTPELRGTLAEYDAAREVEAAKLRAVVAAAKQALADAQHALLSLYLPK